LRKKNIRDGCDNEGSCAIWDDGKGRTKKTEKEKKSVKGNSLNGGSQRKDLFPMAKKKKKKKKGGGGDLQKKKEEIKKQSQTGGGKLGLKGKKKAAKARPGPVGSGGNAYRRKTGKGKREKRY